MPSVNPGVVVGLDVGGTSINATVLDGFGAFLVEALHETPSRVLEGPTVAVEALASALDGVLASTGLRPAAVRAVGLDGLRVDDGDDGGVHGTHTPPM